MWDSCQCSGIGARKLPGCGQKQRAPLEQLVPPGAAVSQEPLSNSKAFPPFSPRIVLWYVSRWPFLLLSWKWVFNLMVKPWPQAMQLFIPCLFSWAWGRQWFRDALTVGLFAEFFRNKQQPLEDNSRYRMYLLPVLKVLPKVKAQETDDKVQRAQCLRSCPKY